LYDIWLNLCPTCLQLPEYDISLLSWEPIHHSFYRPSSAAVPPPLTQHDTAEIDNISGQIHNYSSAIFTSPLYQRTQVEIGGAYPAQFLGIVERFCLQFHLYFIRGVNVTGARSRAQSLNDGRAFLVDLPLLSLVNQ
jgi:hypothetical protein